MRKFAKWLGRMLLAIGLSAGAIWLFSPRETVARSGPFEGDLSDPVAWLAAREAAAGPITPGAEARIIWSDQARGRTPLTVLYLHGFSATSEEIRPVPDNVAAALGANLVFARLTGHGQDGAALARATAGQWIDDTAEALAVARAVGDRVLVIGTSTGATLAALAMTELDMAEGVVGLVFVSPNFKLANPAGAVLTWPLARTWAPWLVGAERRFPTLNEEHARYWTSTYPTVAALPLAALMAETRARDYTGVETPLLVAFAHEDTVVSGEASRGFAQGWGGEVTLAPQSLPSRGVDPRSHVIAGDILSPAMTGPVTSLILDWVARHEF